jgi:hypothetical protein
MERRSEVRNLSSAVTLGAVAVATAFCLDATTSVAQTSPTQARAIPRAPDGRPDLSGFWQVMNSAWLDIQDHSAEKGVPAGRGVVEGNELPYLPAALEKKKQSWANRHIADPVLKCYLPGVPRITYMPFPFQIFQTPGKIGVLYEFVHAVREIYLDSKHLEGPIEWWMGDSRGRWEGDTLVVDVVHFNDQTWFDRAGNHHSEVLHVVERYAFIDPDHLNYEATIEDPNVFSRPWKMSMILYRHTEPDFQLLDYECHAFESAN